MEESEWLMTFMTNLNDITSSWWPFNDGRYEIFKPNIEPTNISYCTVLYHTIPFRPEGDWTFREVPSWQNVVAFVLNSFSRLKAEVRKKCLSMPKFDHNQKGSGPDEHRQDILKQMKFIFGDQVSIKKNFFITSGEAH